MGEEPHWLKIAPQISAQSFVLGSYGAQSTMHNTGNIILSNHIPQAVMGFVVRAIMMVKSSPHLAMDMTNHA